MKKYRYRLKYLSKGFSQNLPTEVIVGGNYRYDGLEGRVVELAQENRDKPLNIRFTYNNQNYQIIFFEVEECDFATPQGTKGEKTNKILVEMKASGIKEGVSDAVKIRQRGFIEVADYHVFGRQKDFMEALFDKKPESKGYFRLRGNYFFWAPKLCKDTKNFSDVAPDKKIILGEERQVRWANVLSSDGMEIYEGELCGNFTEFDYELRERPADRVTFVQEKIISCGIKNQYRFAGIFRYSKDDKMIAYNGKEIKFRKYIRIADRIDLTNF